MIKLRPLIEATSFKDANGKIVKVGDYVYDMNPNPSGVSGNLSFRLLKGRRYKVMKIGKNIELQNTTTNQKTWAGPGRLYLSEGLDEDTIGKVSKQIKITIELDKTVHAGERQTRHVGEEGGEEITNKQILDVAERSIDALHQRLIADKLRVGDKVVVHDRKTNLNLVGTLSDIGRDELEWKIITVMRKANFQASGGTKTVNI